jgi:hypothetical protein
MKLMKKMIFLAIVTAAVTMVSCRKERSCSCTTTETNTYGNFTNTSTSTDKITVEKQRKKFFKAHYDCYSSHTTSADGLSITDRSCTLD